jgi:DNA-binding response OmpR family regulator
MAQSNCNGVLVIDDEQHDIAAIQRSLEQAGHNVFTGGNYQEGLVTFGAHAGEIDLLITDISLPGKTGLELAKACLREKPALKVLFISGWVGAEFLEYFGISKADSHFLAKPFRTSKLLNRVRRILASAEQICWRTTDAKISGAAGA